MPQKSFDDAEMRTAMAAYVEAANALDEASSIGDEPRRLMDLAEAKAVAAMELRKRLVDAGWTAPSGQRTAT